MPYERRWRTTGEEGVSNSFRYRRHGFVVSDGRMTSIGIRDRTNRRRIISHLPRCITTRRVGIPLKGSPQRQEESWYDTPGNYIDPCRAERHIQPSVRGDQGNRSVM